MLFNALFVFSHWYHKCPLILSTPHDFCLCIKNKFIFVQNEIGLLEKWLQITNYKMVESVFTIAANTDYICKDFTIGDYFHVSMNGSWYCGKTELTVVNDIKYCYS